MRGRYGDALRLCGVVVLSTMLTASASYVGALREPTGEGTLGKTARWARSWHLGALVDLAEHVKYSHEPSHTAASELAVDGGNAVESTTTVPPYSPQAIVPVLSPALRGEGEWKAVRQVQGRDAVWVTGVRPSKKFGSVQVTYAVVDQDLTKAALFNGTEVPGGEWRNKNRVPEANQPDLVFAFNGGFLKKHARGGYLTEGREIWKLQAEAATLAIDATGRIHIGEWGRELKPAGFGGKPWVSVRQNLTMLLQDGELFDQRHQKIWGWSGKGELYILRSAVCIRDDGKLLFAIAGPVDAVILAKALQKAGCRNAMQLDVNASYPRGYWYEAGVPNRLDRRMVGADSLYLTGSYREFFALFER